MARRVTGPDGRTWTVRRRLLPALGDETVWGRFRRRWSAAWTRLRRRVGRPGVEALGLADVPSGIGVMVLVLAVVALTLTLVLPVAIAVIDLVVLLAVGGAGLAARCSARRPWRIEVRADDGTQGWDDVIGWRAGTRRAREIAERLEIGADPGLTVAPPTDRPSDPRSGPPSRAPLGAEAGPAPWLPPQPIPRPPSPEAG